MTIVKVVVWNGKEIIGEFEFEPLHLSYATTVFFNQYGSKIGAEIHIDASKETLRFQFGNTPGLEWITADVVEYWRAD